MGKDYEEAFAVASELEKVCARHIVERYREATGKVIDTFEEIHDYVIETIGKRAGTPLLLPLMRANVTARCAT